MRQWETQGGCKLCYKRFAKGFNGVFKLIIRPRYELTVHLGLLIDMDVTHAFWRGFDLDTPLSFI